MPRKKQKRQDFSIILHDKETGYTKRAKNIYGNDADFSSRKKANAYIRHMKKKGKWKSYRPSVVQSGGFSQYYKPKMRLKKRTRIKQFNTVYIS